MTEQERQQWTQYLKLQNMDPGCQSCENYYDDGEPEGGYMYPMCSAHPEYEHRLDYPFKTVQPCFQLGFWHSPFANLIQEDEAGDLNLDIVYNEHFRPWVDAGCSPSDLLALIIQRKDEVRDGRLTR